MFNFIFDNPILPKNLALYIMISGQKMAKTTCRNTVGLDNGHICTQPASIQQWFKRQMTCTCFCLSTGNGKTLKFLSPR